MGQRYREIDATRGVAIIAMVIYHLFFNLVLTNLLSLDFYTGFWWIFPRIIAATFLTVMGLSLTLSYSRKKKAKKFIIRGVFIFGFGLAITLVSYFLFGSRVVLFGILHLIGLSVVISYPLLRFKFINLFLAVVILAVGLWLGRYRFPFYWLLWLGFRPGGYYPSDYLPLLPWFSYVLLGIFLGNLLYPGGKRRFVLNNTGKIIPVRFLCFIGRHSLLIYLVHLPVLYGMCYVLNLLL